VQRYLLITAAEVADEVASATWATARRGLRYFTGGEQAFRTLLVRIAREEALARRRAARSDPQAIVDLVRLDSRHRRRSRDRAVGPLSTERVLRLVATLPPDVAEMFADGLVTPDELVAANQVAFEAYAADSAAVDFHADSGQVAHAYNAIKYDHVHDVIQVSDVKICAHHAGYSGWCAYLKFSSGLRNFLRLRTKLPVGHLEIGLLRTGIMLYHAYG
jgi:hypothetical protein